MTRRVLVTGAAGMLGSALVRQMLAARDLSPRGAYRTKPSNAGLANEVRVVGQIDKSTDWGDALAGCEAVVHCAARAHVLDEKASDPQAAFREVNVDGTLALAAQAVESGVRHFVLVSSAGVHGSSNVVPAQETEVLHPTELYAISKLEAELGLQRLAAGADMTVTIVRPPLIYGPEVRGNMLRLVNLALSGLPLPLGAVHNSRSFVGITNLCDGILTILQDDRAAGRTYLISDQNDVSTPDLITMIAKAAQKSARLWPVPLGAIKVVARLAGRGEMLERLTGSLRVDSNAISTELDWRPPMPMQHDLARMVQWYVRRKLTEGGS